MLAIYLGLACQPSVDKVFQIKIKISHSYKKSIQKFVSLFLKPKKEPFSAYQTLIGDVLNSFSIFCNTSAYGPNVSVTWLQSVNKSSIFILTSSNRTLITKNGQLVNFTTLFLSDQQYYACGVTINKTLVIVNQYFLFVRGNF